MYKNTYTNEHVNNSERSHFLKTQAVPAVEQITGTNYRNQQPKRDVMTTTATSWDSTPVKRGNFICGPHSAFARLFPDKYRHQEESTRKPRSLSIDTQRAGVDHVTIPRIPSDNEDCGGCLDKVKRSRRVRFDTNEYDNSLHIRTKSEPYLNRVDLSTEYLGNEINCDPNPEVIRCDNPKEVVYTQKVGVRYLRPPTPPPPGPLVIREVHPAPPVDPPPLIVSTTPPLPPRTPSPIIVREEPPTPPVYQPPKVITKKLPPLPTPPRRVVIKRKPPLPAKPRPVIIEKWLPYKATPQRPILYQRAEDVDRNRCPQRNVIVQYDPPRVHVKQKVQTFGCFRVDPEAYRAQHGPSLQSTNSIRKVLEKIGCNTDLITSTGYSTNYSTAYNQNENCSHYDYPRQSTTCFTDEQLDALIGTAIPSMKSQSTENHYDIPKLCHDNDDYNLRISSTV
ncbi:unnamed protein product [Adineta ricciae]|uniref:Uncharacterized protein n=1 Tax=Adineta ricciae TaxID=249248 RepID=A0A816GMI8_ADIRI|nr:unnamed protein product [Adineta ricciae]